MTDSSITLALDPTPRSLRVEPPLPGGYTRAVPADPSLISVTAKVAAYYRQFSAIPFAREVAKRIGADAAFDQLLREHGLEHDKLTFYAPMFEARYKSLTQLLQSRAPQVLELASGYTRCRVDPVPPVRVLRPGDVRLATATTSLP